jgi:quercetin dioxygenase-like cupin family protein
MRRIYTLIGLLAFSAVLLTATGFAAESSDMLAVEQRDLTFGPVAGFPACAKAAQVRGDPAKGAAVLMAKLESGCRIPWHWHSASEQIMVVSGSGTVETKDGKKVPLRPGGYASVPGKHVHLAACSNTCTFFVSTDGAFDIHYVDGAGKEISPDEALKKRPASKAPKK